jgi:hypothetical protein
MAVWGAPLERRLYKMMYIPRFHDECVPLLNAASYRFVEVELGCRHRIGNS